MMINLGKQKGNKNNAKKWNNIYGETTIKRKTSTEKRRVIDKTFNKEKDIQRSDKKGKTEYRDNLGNNNNRINDDNSSLLGTRTETGKLQ